MRWPTEPRDGGACLSQMHSWAPLQVLHGHAEVLFPVSGVGSYGPADAPLGSLENGMGPEDHILPEPGPRYSVEASPPGQESPLSSLLPSASVPESMTVSDLRQAIVAMMNRKDELEEENRSLRNLLDGEMEHSAALRQEVDTLKRKVAEQEERHVTKVQALARENEVLKVQLKKYVGAVQMLKREGQTAEVVPNLWNVDGEVTVPEQKPGEVAEELASSYERKLIEVAEMHGELIEFNERLHRALVAKEALVSQMRQELIDLRGPVPGDLSQTSEDQSLSDFEISNRALINVWIPSVFLRGKAANAFHVYQGPQRGECEKGASMLIWGLRESRRMLRRPSHGAVEGERRNLTSRAAGLLWSEDLEGKEVQALQLLERKGRQGAFCSSGFVLDCGSK